MSDLSELLGYEYINDADMERAQAFERQKCQEHRDLVKWFSSELVFVILSYGVKRRNYVKPN